MATMGRRIAPWRGPHDGGRAAVAVDPHTLAAAVATAAAAGGAEADIDCGAHQADDGAAGVGVCGCRSVDSLPRLFALTRDKQHTQ